MALIAVISGSPSPSSRTMLLCRHVAARLAAEGFQVEMVDIRTLPAADLVAGNMEAPRIREAAGLVERAQGLVIATPVYKAAYSGALKTFLDLLPQFALAGKTVMPLATGGSLAHVLSIDYALRPVLASMGARHVVNGFFFIDKQLERIEPDGLRIETQAEERFEPLLKDFISSLRQL